MSPPFSPTLQARPQRASLGYIGAPSVLADPTWGNHWAIYRDAGLEGKKYTYYKPETRGLDFDGLIADFKAMPNGSLIVMHACAHNPTGVDPTQEQWKQISKVRGRLVCGI